MSRVFAALLVAIGLAAGGFFVGHGFLEGRAADRYVTVKGVAEREVEADVALWPLTVSVTDDALPKAHEQLRRSVDAVRAFLVANGIPTDAVNVQGLTVTDALAERYRSEPAAGNRYIVSQTLLVRSGDPKGVLAASGRISDLVGSGVVLQSGGYQNGPSFLFTRLNDLKPEMIAEATARAREAAEKFAQDSGAAVGGIRRANQGVFQILARDQVASIDEQRQLNKIVRVVTTVEYFLER